MQAAGTGSPDSMTDIPITTRGTRIPTAASATTIFVEAGQGKEGGSATAFGRG